MRIKQIAALLAAVLMLVSFSSCSNRGNEESSSGSEAENRLVIYHGNEELTVPLTNLVKAYNAAENKSVGVKLAGSGYLNEAKNEKAALYVVDSETGLSDWYEGGMFGNLAEDNSLGGAFGDIPAGLQLNQNGLGSYGIPLMLYGCGYIFDYGLLEDLFGNASANALAEDLSLCSYTDFEGFVEAVSTYIATPSAASVTVEGNKYTFAAEKTGRAKNLTGVFSLSYDSTSAEEALLSYALASEYSNSFEIISAGAEDLSPESNAFSAYTEALDMHTSHIAGKEGGATRGEAFAGGDFDYTGAIDLFAHNYALFYPGNTLDAADFSKSVEGYDARLGIIPMKLPLDDGKITAGGISSEKLQSSIVIGSRYYLTLNPNADAERLSEARDFIKWVFNEEAGRTAFSSAFGGLAYNYTVGGTGNGSSTESQITSSGNQNSETGSNANSSGNAITSSAGTNSKAIGRTASQNSGTGSTADPGSLADGENSAGGENSLLSGDSSEIAEGPSPNYNMSDSLAAAVAEYYAEGRWLPMLSKSLPEGWTSSVLSPALRDYFGMETWSDTDRTDFAGTLISGWSGMLGGTNSNENSLGDIDGDGIIESGKDSSAASGAKRLP